MKELLKRITLTQVNAVIAIILFPLLSESEFTYASTRHKSVNVIKDISFENQVNTPNTYYVIKDYIDLQGKTINIPSHSILKFEGGQLGNGTLVGADTYIEAGVYTIFENDIILEGTYKASEAYPEWFESTDDAIKIREALEHFENVKLTAKHYLLESVNSDGYGVIIPSGHILQGNRCANNTMSDDQTIKLKNGIPYRAVVALSNNTILQNLTIRGDRQDNTSCVATVKGFQSRLTIDRVGVSGSYYGFNLQAYLTNLVQCTANYNEIGFFIHGDISGNTVSVEGTSINLNTCYAVDSKIAGYELYGLTYSTMNNCAADGCGGPVSGELNNRSKVGYAYSLKQSKNITINSCGAENCLAALITQNCKNLILNSPSFQINKRKDVKVATDYVLKPIINIRYSAFIELNYMFVNVSGMSKYYSNNSPLMLLYGSAHSLPSVIVKNGYEGIKYSNIGTEGFLSKEKNLIYE